jgi:hypothetical protein
MHLLYLDESGTVSDPGQKFFILAGLSVFERSTHWLERDLDEIAKRFVRGADTSRDIELHGSPMRTGQKVWRGFPVADRLQAIKDALSLIQTHCPRDVRIFAVALNKENHSGQDIAEVAFTQACSRFDQFLMRLYRSKNDAQRGLIVFDKSNAENRIQTLARDFKYEGHTFGVTRNYAEVPVFLDSRASRLIQLADLIAYAMSRHFEHQDSQFYDIIKNCFDAEGGVTHGLYSR